MKRFAVWFAIPCLLAACRPGGDPPQPARLSVGAGSEASVAALLRESGNYEGTAALLRLRLTRDPSDWDARFELADLYLELELPYRAAELLANEDPPEERRAGYFRRLAAGLYRTGDYDAALEAYRRLSGEPGGDRRTRGTALAGQAKCLRELGRYGEALEIFRVLEDSGGGFWVEYDMGKCYEAAGDETGALACYRKAFVLRHTAGAGYLGLIERKLAGLLFDGALRDRERGESAEARAALMEITNTPDLDSTRYGEMARFWLERI